MTTSTRTRTDRTPKVTCEPIGAHIIDASAYERDEWAHVVVSLIGEIDAKGRKSGHIARIEAIDDDGGWAEVSALSGDWDVDCGYRVRDNNGQMDIIVADIGEAAGAIATLAMT